MHIVMSDQLIRPGKLLLTARPSATERLLTCFTCMSPGVRLQVVRSGELSLACFTLEGFDTCVSSLVPFQLIRTRESPLAVFKVTLVGFLTCVLSTVHLQMGQLEVSLVAPRIRTHEGSLFIGF